MFYTYEYLYKQPATRLNKHLLYFFRKLRLIDSKARFRTDNTLFHTEFLPRLNHHRATELQEVFKRFFDAYKVLLPLEKAAVLKQFDNIQTVNTWLSDDSLNEKIIENKNLPNSLRKPTQDLFLYLYNNTIKADLAKHYSLLYKNLENKHCPFCGMYKLPFPTDRKADYDHWLCKKDYPFLAVNMRNLVPICERCNQVYKKEQNVLIDEFSHRRKFLDPFKNSYKVKLDLTGSILPDANNQNSNWQISFTPTNNIIENWAKVFSIKQRYINELNEEFGEWTNEFRKRHKTNVKDITSLKRAFKGDAETIEDNLYRHSNIIKHGLFIFLAECDDQMYYNATLKNMSLMKI